MIGLGAGLLLGILVGALLLAEDSGAPAPAAVAQTPAPATDTPKPTPEPAPLPTESPDWEPCAKPGLCDFIDKLNGRVLAQDVDGVMALVEFDEMQCGSAETQQYEGIFPLECRDWPYDDPIPTVGYAQQDRAGHPVSRWAVRDELDGFISSKETDCSGEQVETERRVTIVISPPDPTLYWNGEVSLLVGARLDCIPAFDADGSQRYLFNLRPNEAGDWKIESIVEVPFDTCDHPYYRAAGVELRYYPLDEGPPVIAGSLATVICLVKLG
jgi:hypothetical protein